MQIHSVGSITTTTLSITVAREAMPNAARGEQTYASAMQRFLPAEEAVRRALLTPSKTYRERLPRPSAPLDQTGMLLDVRA